MSELGAGVEYSLLHPSKFNWVFWGFNDTKQLQVEVKKESRVRIVQV